MALKHTPKDCAEEIVQIGKKNFGWKVGGLPVSHQAIQGYWYNDDFGKEELTAGIKYGVENDWFTVTPGARGMASAVLNLQPTGYAAV